jgi:hypothetical protein
VRAASMVAGLKHSPSSWLYTARYLRHSAFSTRHRYLQTVHGNCAPLQHMIAFRARRVGTGKVCTQNRAWRARKAVQAAKVAQKGVCRK